MVVIPAGVPRKPGMTRDDLFNTNAGIVKTLVEGCGKFAPDAVLAIISNPVRFEITSPRLLPRAPPPAHPVPSPIPSPAPRRSTPPHARRAGQLDRADRGGGAQEAGRV